MQSLRWILILVGFCATQGQAQDQERQFQEAIHLMETKGDYPAAIRLFEEVVKGTDRTLAARSLLYRGICYEKLGREEAQRAYQRLIREFPDQTQPRSPRPAPSLRPWAPKSH